MCVTSPDISIGLSARLYAGIRTSSDKFFGSLAGWLSFINSDNKFFDQELPIWSYPATDNEADLTGCRVVN